MKHKAWTGWMLSERGRVAPGMAWEMKDKQLAKEWARDTRRSYPECKPVCVVKVRVEVIK